MASAPNQTLSPDQQKIAKKAQRNWLIAQVLTLIPLGLAIYYLRFLDHGLTADQVDMWHIVIAVAFVAIQAPLFVFLFVRPMQKVKQNAR